MAHIVERLSRYLDVPLRYPIKPAMSKSLICDMSPAHYTQASPDGKPLAHYGW